MPALALVQKSAFRTYRETDANWVKLPDQVDSKPAGEDAMLKHFDHVTIVVRAGDGNRSAPEPLAATAMPPLGDVLRRASPSSRG
jgi:hypothetical protein